MFLLQVDEGLSGLGGNPEQRRVGMARLGAEDGDEGVKRSDGAPEWSRGCSQRNRGDAFIILDGLGMADGNDDTMLDMGDIVPGKNLP